MTFNNSIRVVFLGAIAIFCLVANAGDLEPMGPPAPTMLSLQELNDRLAPPPDGCFDNVGRFAVCGDGTMKDTFTDLVWLVDANCLGGGTTWAQASLWAEQLADGQCGLTDGSFAGDWRLPTEVEWKFVMDQALANACAGPFFPDVTGLGCCAAGTCPLSGLASDQYWSSDTLTVNPPLARTASVGGGFITQQPKAGTFLSTPVRDRR